MRFHNFIKGEPGWNLTEDEIQFANPYVEVHHVKVTSPTRSTPFSWTVTHRKAAVVIVPQTADGKLVLVRQERVPIRSTIWEFPAGQIDDHEDPDTINRTGLRELAEEAGYELGENGELISLGLFYPSAGFTDEHSHLLLARSVVLSPHGARPDANEAFIDCRAFSVAEFKGMIASGEIRDANTLAAFARLVALGRLPV